MTNSPSISAPAKSKEHPGAFGHQAYFLCDVGRKQRFEKERELTLELRRWQRAFINDIAADVGFTAEWHDPFISTEGLETYGAGFFENYLANPQSKLLRLTRTV